MNPSVTDNRALNRFELPIDGQSAFLTYEPTPDSIRLLHTEVPDQFRGRRFGEALVTGALALARAEGLRIVAVCPSFRAYLRKHPIAGN